MKIKKLLKKILPAPAETFDKGTESLYSHISDLENRLKSLEREQQELEKLLCYSLNPEHYPHIIKLWYQDRTGKVLHLEGSENLQ